MSFGTNVTKCPEPFSRILWFLWRSCLRLATSLVACSSRTFICRLLFFFFEHIQLFFLKPLPRAPRWGSWTGLCNDKLGWVQQRRNSGTGIWTGIWWWLGGRGYEDLSKSTSYLYQWSWLSRGAPPRSFWCWSWHPEWIVVGKLCPLPARSGPRLPPSGPFRFGLGRDSSIYCHCIL